MSVRTLTNDNFDDVVGVEDLVILYFTSPTCGPCKSFTPIIEKLAACESDAVFVKVDVQDSPEIAADFQVRSVPMLMILRQEIAVFAEAGTLTEAALADLIAQARQVDLAQLRQTLS